MATVKHDEQAKFIDGESVFPQKIPDYQKHLILVNKEVKR